MSIFDQVLGNFEQYATPTSFGADNIGSFIERTWKDVPATLLLEAIDKVSETTKEQGTQSHYSMASGKGSVADSSGTRQIQSRCTLASADRG